MTAVRFRARYHGFVVAIATARDVTTVRFYLWFRVDTRSSDLGALSDSAVARDARVWLLRVRCLHARSFRRRERVPAEPVAVRGVVPEPGRRVRVRMSGRVRAGHRGQQHVPGPGRVRGRAAHLPAAVRQHARVVQVRMPAGLPAGRRPLSG